MSTAALETRDALAPFVGSWARCRGLGVHVERHHRQVRTLVRALLVDVPDRGWVRAADHVWVWGSSGADLCRGDTLTPVEFEARVHAYESPTVTGGVLWRYGLGRVRNVAPLGGEGPGDPAAAAVGLVVAAWGWERVADLVAGLHGEG